MQSYILNRNIEKIYINFTFMYMYKNKNDFYL